MYGAPPSTPFIYVEFSGDATAGRQCFPAVPRVGDRIEYFDNSFVVKDVIWTNGNRGGWHARLVLEEIKPPTSTN